MANITLELMENCQTEVSTGEKRIGKSSDSSLTTSAVVAMEINLTKFRTSTAVHLGMTYQDKRKHLMCRITSFSGDAFFFLQLRLIAISKILLIAFFAQICYGNPASDMQQKCNINCIWNHQGCVNSR